MRILFTLLLLPIFSYAQDISFHKAYGNNEFDYGESIVQLEDSSYVIAGATSSFGSGNSDALLMGIDKFGNFNWQRTFGNEQIEWAEDIILHSNESLYTLGYTNDSNGNGYDIILIKTDQEGSLDWQQRYGGSDWDFAYELIETQDGNIVICGETYSDTNGENDAYFMKIDAENGMLIWENKFGGEKHDTFFDLTEDFEGNLWFTGYSVFNDSDLVILKTDAAGEELNLVHQEIGEHVIGSVIKTHVTGEILLGYDYWKSNSIDSVETGRWKLDTDANVVWQRFDPENETTRFVVDITPLANENFFFTTRSLNGNTNGDIWMFSNGGWFMSISGTNSYGNFLDDDFKTTISTSDGGIIHVGTTESWGFGSSSAWLVKQNSSFQAPEDAEEEYVTSTREIKRDLAIYPNPVNDIMHLEFPFTETMEYRIFDMNGRMIKFGILSQSLNVSDLINGKYFLTIRNKNQIHVIDFIKHN